MLGFRIDRPSMWRSEARHNVTTDIRFIDYLFRPKTSHRTTPFVLFSLFLHLYHQPTHIPYPYLSYVFSSLVLDVLLYFMTSIRFFTPRDEMTMMTMMIDETSGRRSLQHVQPLPYPTLPYPTLKAFHYDAHTDEEDDVTKGCGH